VRISTDAIILSSIDFLESDKIVCALTKDRGIVHAIAKGAKQSKKRFPGTLDQFCEVTLDIFSRKNSDLKRLESATLISAHLAIREDLDILAHASVLIELIKENLGELDPSPWTYEALRRALASMETGVQWFSIWCISMIGILSTLGYGIEFNQGVSGQDKKRQGISYEGLSKEARMFIVRASALDHSVLKKLTIGRVTKMEITGFLLRVSNRVSEKKLKSSAFLAKLLDLNIIQ